MLKEAFRAQAEGRSYVIGCLIECNPDPLDAPPALFETTSDAVIVRLFEYAIIPLAHYNRLTEIEDQWNKLR